MRLSFVVFLVVLGSCLVTSVSAQPITFVSEWGGSGTGDGQFVRPRGITVDGFGNVYVADHNNERVQKFDTFGAFWTKWGTPGSGDGDFFSVHDVAVDGSGTFLAKWGINGSGPGQLSFPRGLAADGLGHVYVVDSGNDRVQKFLDEAAVPRVPLLGPRGAIGLAVLLTLGLTGPVVATKTRRDDPDGRATS